VRLPLTFLLAVQFLCAQAPQKIDKVCTDEDVEALGLTCSEDEPCPVFLELAAVEASGSALFLTGNLHTVNVTIFGLLLSSDDNGVTWKEPGKRLRSTALEQIQFLDFQHGWISGMKVEALPKDPFLLITGDGGKTWHQNLLFDESRFGSIQQFWFDSATGGQLILDRSQGRTKSLELYESNTGGTSWDLKEATNKDLQLPKARPAQNPSWRIRAEADAYRIERRTAAGGWSPVTSFAIRAGECR
jgi:hypothetical protein